MDNVMKNLYLLLGMLVVASFCWSRSVMTNPPLNVRTVDGTTSGYPYQLKVTNSSLTDNGDGTMTLAYSTASANSGIFNQNTLQSGATFYVSSGTATNFNTTTLKFADGTTQTTAASGGSGILNQNTLQDGATFYVSSGTIAGSFKIVDANSATNSYRKQLSVNFTDSGPVSESSSIGKQSVSVTPTYSGNFTGGSGSLELATVYSAPIFTGSVDGDGDGAEVTVYGLQTQPSRPSGSIVNGNDRLTMYGLYANNISNLGTTGLTAKYGVAVGMAGSADETFGVFSSASGGTVAYNFYADGTPLNYFGGNVGIGQLVPTSQLHTTGSVRFANFGAGAATFDANGNISSVSDERLKDIKGKFKVGLKDILKIEPIIYKWNKKSGLEMDHLYAGFSAQNVQKAIPEAVGENGKGILSLQDRALLAALVNSVKELNEKIQKLEKRKP